MQISSHSHSRFSGSKKNTKQRGFTLVELLIVLSVTALISTVVVTRFAAFDSAILLKSEAYELAVALREAQVYSLSVLGDTDDFDTPYGITLSPATPKAYSLFRYIHTSKTIQPRYDGSAIDIDQFTLDRSVEIADLCVVTNDPDNPECGLTRLDISFRRPEFESLFFALDSGGAEVNYDNVTSAQIRLQSTGALDVWVVEIFLLGQITVYREEA